MDVCINLCVFKCYTAYLYEILFAGLWNISLPRKVMFCSVSLIAALALTFLSAMFIIIINLGKLYMYSLEIVVNSLHTSEIIPKICNRECWPFLQ